VHLNILCLVSINSHYTLNYAEFDRNTWILPNFQLGRTRHTVKVTTMIICTHNQCRGNSTRTQDLDPDYLEASYVTKKLKLYLQKIKQTEG